MKLKILSSAIVLIIILMSSSPLDAMAVSGDFTAATVSVEQNLKNVVYIECGSVIDGEYVSEASGSGVVLDDGLVITNAHVVSYDGGDYWYFYDWCVGGISSVSYEAPEFSINLEINEDYFRRDDFYDYALLNAYDADWNEYVFESIAKYSNADSLVHSDDVTLIGYPALTGSTVTSTYGSISGFEGTNWIKTDAIAEFGNSGGGAFDVNGNFIGIPTLVVTGELNSITYILNINAILEDMLGVDAVVRDYETLYTIENVTCMGDICYQFGEDVDDVGISEQVEVVEPTLQVTPPIIEENTNSSGSTESDSSKYNVSMHSQSLIDRMIGRILLQVEQHGEAWYVHPVNKARYYMKDGPTAYQMMREFGLGITDIDLEKIPTVEDSNEMNESSSVCASNSTANRLKGRLLLQVEQHGEAWYIHPDKCRKIYMKDGDAAYSIMRYLSQGIADIDLKKMPSDSL